MFVVVMTIDSCSCLCSTLISLSTWVNGGDQWRHGQPGGAHGHNGPVIRKQPAVRPQQHRARAFRVGRRRDHLQRGHLRADRLDPGLVDLLHPGRLPRRRPGRGADPRGDHQHPRADHVRAAGGQHAPGGRRLRLGEPDPEPAAGADLQPVHDHGRPARRGLLRQVLLGLRARPRPGRGRQPVPQQHDGQLGHLVPDRQGLDPGRGPGHGRAADLHPDPRHEVDVPLAERRVPDRDGRDDRDVPRPGLRHQGRVPAQLQRAPSSR